MPQRALSTAVIFSVGNTVGGCEFALRWILKEAGQVPHLYFFYGHAFAGQTPSPLSMVHSMLTNPEFAHLPRGGEQATQGNSLDRAYSDAQEFTRTIEASGFDRVYVGITGGTNPMVAALFHAAMSELTCEVIPVYVQGKQGSEGQNSLELIPGRGTRDAILMERVLHLARHGQLTAARAMAENLPERGRAGFVRRSIAAFALWDNFEYQAATTIGELARRGRDFAEDRLLEPMLGTLERYCAFAHHAFEMEAVFRVPAEFARTSQKKGWDQQVRNRAYWLPLDALANGWRRLEAGRPTDAVLRAYRAVEIAVHCRLFALGVHPSELDWERAPLNAVAEAWPEAWGRQPKVVALDHALHLLSLLTGEDLGDTGDVLRRIQHCRNHCYLEHGYQRIDADTGRGVLKLAKDLVNRILWNLRIEEGARLRMDF